MPRILDVVDDYWGLLMEEKFNESGELPVSEMSAMPKNESAGQGPANEASREETEALENKEENLAKELSQAKEQYLRLAAELDNFKKVSAREQASAVKFANSAIIEALLPVIDNLEQALLVGRNSEESKTKELCFGIEMVLRLFADVLRKFGAESFNSIGEKFDPAKHEAMTEQESLDKEAGIILSEYQKGYFYQGRLLRPARVVVAKKPA